MEGLVFHSRIDLGGAHVPVPECSLDQSQVPGLPVEVHGKGVTERVDGEVPLDTSLAEPVLEAELDLAVG